MKGWGTSVGYHVGNGSRHLKGRVSWSHDCHCEDLSGCSGRLRIYGPISSREVSPIAHFHHFVSCNSKETSFLYSGPYACGLEILIAYLAIISRPRDPGKHSQRLANSRKNRKYLGNRERSGDPESKAPKDQSWQSMIIRTKRKAKTVRKNPQWPEQWKSLNTGWLHY